ncbi:branched-chain amino acid aminotransferase [bacterium AH-315-K03]|nr:branched-chain amino acid aminotransferase [bacterium AH-315-K03]
MDSVELSLQIDPEIYNSLADFTLPDDLGFGRTMVPIMYTASYDGERWHSRKLLPYTPISIDPAAKVLHYSQEIFEGMKAYCVGNKSPSLFRPKENWKRINRSARHLCMPSIPESIFMEGVESITAFSQAFIPRESGCALYLRPFMIGVDADLSLTASRRYLFMVIASPSAAYQAGKMRVKIDFENSRASVGGTGHVKTGGNYAAAMRSSQRTVDVGFHQTLWLDPRERTYIEELSGMNVFAVINGDLHTPELSGSILPGITRDSVIQLARFLGYTVKESRISAVELLESINSGQCTEMFACGTAAIIVSIDVLGGNRLAPCHFPSDTPVATQLCQNLLAIQEVSAEDPFAWSHHIPQSIHFSGAHDCVQTC